MRESVWPLLALLSRCGGGAVSARDGFRDRWRAEVLKSTLITDSVRVLLLALADFMTPYGYVSKPRSELVNLLGRSAPRITERIQSAIEAGYLDTVRAGRPGLTAEYCACLPDIALGTPVRTKLTTGQVKARLVRPSEQSLGTPVRTKPIGTDRAALGPDGGVANARASTSATRQRSATGRDERSVVPVKSAPTKRWVYASPPSSGSRLVRLDSTTWQVAA